MTLKDIIIGTLLSFAFAIILLAWFVMSGTMGLAGYPEVACAVGILIVLSAFFAYSPVYKN